MAPTDKTDTASPSPGRKIPWINVRLMVETVVIFVALAMIAMAVWRVTEPGIMRWVLYLPVLLFQGLWLYRCYIVGHEAAHRKLFPRQRLLNDLAGSLALLPLMVPITIYRQIHAFHHGFNRKDPHTSALDTFVIRGRPTWWKKAWYHALWYLSVFFGGFFLHSFVSVVLFLFVPPSLSRRISPAFRQWTMKDQAGAILLFLCGLGLHFLVWRLGGRETYLLGLGLPFLSFAWVLSLLLYIFHYDTTIGDQVRYNVRSVRPVPLLSWVLMNFNEHATHHQYPNIPWHELPQKRQDLPEPFAGQNQQTEHFLTAVLRQFRGPILLYADTDTPGNSR